MPHVLNCVERTTLISLVIATLENLHQISLYRVVYSSLLSKRGEATVLAHSVGKLRAVLLM